MSDETVCAYLSCPFAATAEVPIGGRMLPVCFDHEREWADRYGPADIRPLMSSRVAEAWRTGRHSSGAGMASYVAALYDGSS